MVIPLATARAPSMVTDPTAAAMVKPTVMNIPSTAEPPLAVK